ncbi:MAG: DNA-processing protein DprA [Candidatus Omnitrophica bacterium]|nr:DNA-processing protein DprA [Candidatus Omnitrophota bacterium]
MKLDREKLYPWLAILRAKFMGSGRAMLLQEHFGSIQNVLHAPVDAIAAVSGFSREIGQAIHAAAQGQFDRDIDKELSWAEKEGVSILLYSDQGYPPTLRHIPAPPALLYVKGALRPEDILAVGIVGSRSASDGGRRLANKIACELAEAGLTIVSGLAWGVDASAHKGALRCKQGRTLAVMGNGLKFIYPREHSLIAEQIVQRGALVTELFYDVSPQGRNFPPRNRIISGLSLGVLIAEAPERSGALITADYALEQGKEIFALPGNIERGVSPGTNRLIQESRATLVTSAEDILRELSDKITFYRNELEGKIPKVDLEVPPPILHRKRKGSSKPADASPTAAQPHPADAPVASPPAESPPKKKPPSIPMSDEEKSVHDMLTEEAQHIDAICRKMQWPVSRVSSALGLLELKGVVERESGMRFRLADR